MNLTFLGTGKVGAPLAARLAQAGHAVTLAQTHHDSATLAQALGRSSRLVARDLDHAVHDAEVVFLAVPFDALNTLLPPLAKALAGKVVVDCTNPVGPGLTHGLDNARSGSELIQSLLPGALVVKAFSIYGFENLEDLGVDLPEARPTMFFCGEDPTAKTHVATLIAQCGFEPLDVGGLVQALHLEHMTLLWVRMVRVQGHSPHLMWKALQAQRPKSM